MAVAVVVVLTSISSCLGDTLSEFANRLSRNGFEGLELLPTRKDKIVFSSACIYWRINQEKTSCVCTVNQERAT